LTPGEYAAYWLRLQHPQGRTGRKRKLAPPALIRFTCRARFFGLVDVSLAEAVEVFVRRADAERTLAELLRDEPQWQPLFRIEAVEIGDLCWN
jgi:hypothetical protein